MPLIGVEAAAASAVAWLASVIVIAYGIDWGGGAIAPFATLTLSLLAAGGVYVGLSRRAVRDVAALGAFAAVVLITFGWLIWRARPDFLPTGTGSDLAHHLALLAYIERHGHLAHEAALGAYLGEMIDYTPGLHLLSVLAGIWLHRDALHVVHGVLALTVALKSGILLLIARRLMPDGVSRVASALVAVLLLWLPYEFFAGSFMEQSFLAQVASELFAVAMWGTLVSWDQQPSAAAMGLFALFGAGAFLTWPVWIGPLALTLIVVVAARRELTRRLQVRHLAVALLPIALVAAVYASARQVYGFRMVNAVGFAVWPTPQTLGWPFIALSAAGIACSAIDRRARSAALLLGAVAVQAAALIVTGRSGGATTPYLSLKMAYLAIYPLSIAAAVAIAHGWRALVRHPASRQYGWVPVSIALLAACRSVASSAAPTPVVTQPVFLAGDWARAHLSPGCVDYMVPDGNTAYWLHLAVFGNPRAAGRIADPATFDPKQALIRWIYPGGLPYAVVADFDALPRDIRSGVDILARFGPAAVVQRRAPSACDDDRRNRAVFSDRGQRSVVP
jgi:hypothetical protein